MTNVSQTFSALGDETRFALTERLLKEGELSAGALREGLSISGPAISRHLKILRNAGLLNQRIAGQHRLYSVRSQAFEEIQNWTLSHRKFWDESLSRLETSLSLEEEK